MSNDTHFTPRDEAEERLATVEDMTLYPIEIVTVNDPEVFAQLGERVPNPPNLGQALSLIGKARDITAILDGKTRESAGNLITDLAQQRKKVDEHFKPAADAANKLHKTITGRRNLIFDKIDEARRSVEQLALDYDREEDRKRREREAQLRKEAEERAAAERKRLEDEAAEKAAQLEAEGKADEAEQVLTQAVSESERPVPIPTFSVPRHSTGSSSTRQNWTCTVEDMAALMQAALENPAAYMGYLNNTTVREAVEKVIRPTAKSMKDDLKIPGVRVWNDERIAAGRK